MTSIDQTQAQLNTHTLEQTIQPMRRGRPQKQQGSTQGTSNGLFSLDQAFVTFSAEASASHSLEAVNQDPFGSSTSSNNNVSNKKKSNDAFDFFAGLN